VLRRTVKRSACFCHVRQSSFSERWVKQPLSFVNRTYLLLSFFSHYEAGAAWAARYVEQHGTAFTVPFYELFFYFMRFVSILCSTH
jgi:hypothetical protein